mgnify:CR=1 FL=1
MTRAQSRSVTHDNTTYATVDLSKDDYQEFYNGFANRVLWPILHYRLDLAEFTRRDLGGYFGSTSISPLISKNCCGRMMSCGCMTIT